MVSRSAGREVCNDFRLLGAVPAAVQGSADITNICTTYCGTPAVGTKISVQVFQYQDGYQDLPVEFTAVVPAASYPSADACAVVLVTTVGRLELAPRSSNWRKAP